MKTIAIVFVIVGLVVGVAYASVEDLEKAIAEKEALRLEKLARVRKNLDKLSGRYGVDVSSKEQQEDNESLKEIFKKEYREEAKLVRIMSEAKAEVDAEFQIQKANSINALAKNPEIISSIIGFLAAVVYAGATCFAAVIAIKSVRSWRKEFTGKRKIEVTSDTLELLYKVKSVLRSIRSNWLIENEGTTRKVTENETSLEKKFRDEAYSRVERFERHEDIFNELISTKFKYMAVVNKEAEKYFDKIKHIVNTILVYVPHYADAKIERHDLVEEKRQLKRTNSDITEVEKKLAQIKTTIQEYESILCHQGKDDTFDKDIDEIISEIENDKQIIRGN